MDMETGMFCKPCFDLGVFMRRIVVADQMQGFVLGRFPINLAQKIQPFDVPMTLCATRDHRAIQRAHGREQGCGPVALVIVRHRFRASFFQRQAGLGPIKGLYLAFLVAAQHQGVFGWRHVQAHDVFELLDKFWITRHLEGFDSVGLEAMGAPHLEHRGIRDAHLGGQCARAPVGGALPRRLCRDPHDLCRINSRLTAAARQVAFNGRKATLRKPVTPATRLNPADPQLAGNLAITPPVGCQQHDPRSSHRTNIQRLRSHSALQFGSLPRGQVDRRAKILHTQHP